MTNTIIIAEGLLSDVMTRYEVTKHQIVQRFKGEVLEGLLLQHPLFDERQVPVILG